VEVKQLSGLTFGLLEGTTKKLVFCIKTVLAQHSNATEENRGKF